MLMMRTYVDLLLNPKGHRLWQFDVSAEKYFILYVNFLVGCPLHLGGRDLSTERFGCLCESRIQMA